MNYKLYKQLWSFDRQGNRKIFFGCLEVMYYPPPANLNRDKAFRMIYVCVKKHIG